ncbi:MAG: lytic transglycosylase domain-containing protein [Candidatus Berkelbacteria bacterium]|nr:lytic transglycosylase domain-containing protein [Candidatus Berkelbacteria bacterium]
MHKKRKIIHLSIWVTVLVVSLSVYFLVPKYFADDVYPLKYTDWIVEYSTKYNVSPSLVAAVILQESRFNPKAASGAGAQGLMQFMPGTAATMAKETGHWPKYDIFDPETSIEFGAAHLRDLLNKYNNNVDQALAGYNAGTGTVDRWVGLNIFERIINSNSNSETVNYVKKVKHYEEVYRTMYATQLGMKDMTKIELRATTVDQTTAQVRGFVWTQLFNSVFTLPKN